MIQLQTLDDAVITIGDREVRPTSPTLFAALLYLGVERGQRVSRAALQELLFPETDERSGAHSMRQLLYKLRQLGASVHAEGDVVWLAPEDVVDDYSAPAHTNGNGNGNGKGHGHGAGGFLAGYAPRVSKAFDEWLESRRSAVEAARRRALIKYMLARRDVADWITVERIAQEVLATDPFNEEATFALAESTALGGSKSEAIRMLERYEGETGRADLKLPAAILRRRISERLPDRRRRALDTPFVGRDAEAEVMRQAVVNLRAGDGGSVVISGEPGIGKTRLIEETSAIALLEGVNVHVVRCQPHYVSRPMSVFIEWVPMLMQSRGALGVDPQTLEHLTLLTSHRDDRANRPTDARDDATRSGTLMAAVRDLVDAVASETPILLVVEDAHWADTASLKELCTLLEKRRCSGLQIIYSTRVLDALKEIGVVSDATHLLRLRPLVDGSMQRLSRYLLAAVDQRESTELTDWCAKTAGGNPLYLQLLCAHYDDTRTPFAVPPSIRAATARRIAALAPDSRRILELAVLFGRHATVGMLRRQAALTDRAFLDGLQFLEESGFLKTQDGAAQVTHELLRDSLLETIPPLTLQGLHAIVAAGLEGEYRATDDASLLWDCAEHWSATGESSKALRFVLGCARHASDIGHATEALELLQRSRRFAGTNGDVIALLDETSRVAKAVRRWRVVLEVEAEVGALMPRNSGHTESELRAIEAAWAVTLTTPATDILSCTRAIDASPSHRVEAAFLAVRIAHETGDIPLANDAYEAVQPLLQGDSGGSGAMLQVIYHTSFGDRALALTTAKRIRNSLHESDIGTQIRTARNLGIAFCFLGHPSEGFDIARTYYDLSTQLDLSAWRFDFASSCSQAQLNIGDFDEAARWFALADAVSTPSVEPSIMLAHAISGLEIALHQGDAETACTRAKSLALLSTGDSFRMRAHIFSIHIRMAQMDAGFQCSEKDLLELRRLLERSTPLLVSDGVATALLEGLYRLGRNSELRTTLSAYLVTRRHLIPLPSTIQKFVRQFELPADPPDSRRRAGAE